MSIHLGRCDELSSHEGHIFWQDGFQMKCIGLDAKECRSAGMIGTADALEAMADERAMRAKMADVMSSPEKLDAYARDTAQEVLDYCKANPIL